MICEYMMILGILLILIIFHRNKWNYNFFMKYIIRIISKILFLTVFHCGVILYDLSLWQMKCALLFVPHKDTVFKMFYVYTCVLYSKRGRCVPSTAWTHYCRAPSSPPWIWQRSVSSSMSQNAPSWLRLAPTQRRTNSSCRCLWNKWM